MDELRKALHEEIQAEFEALKDEPIGSENYDSIMGELTKLIDKAIEINKIDTDYELKRDARDVETALKVRQMDADKKDRCVKYGISIGEIAAYVGVVIWGARKTFKFEETGTITSDAGREFIKKILTLKFFKR